MSTISVVIPAYNGAPFIAAAIQSVLSQTVLPQEVIVVDDASKDNTADTVAGLARVNPVPIRLIKLRRNSGGPGRPMNVGIEAAASELICVLDQDDLLLPDKLADQAEVFERTPGVACVAALCAMTDRPQEALLKPAILEELPAISNRALDGRVMMERLIDYGQFLVGYPAFMFAKATWAAVGGVNEDLRIASDLDFLLRLCSQGKVVILPKIHYLKRTHADNLSYGKRPAVDLERATVRAWCLCRERWLLADPVRSRELRHDFALHAYWARQAHLFRHAFWYSYLAARVWGLHASIVRDFLKLIVHGSASLLSLRKPAYCDWTR